VRWISKQAPVKADLFDPIPGFDPGNSRTHARRDVSSTELAQVLEAALISKRTIRSLTENDRYHLYLTAFATGFRAGELSILRPSLFHLESDPPAVSLPGKNAKNKKGVRFPLAPSVAVQLRTYLKHKRTDQPIWPGKWRLHAAKMLRVDLAAAGVPYQTEGVNGPEFCDFHSLRHTFCSALAAAGTGPKELQMLARHSDPRLTLGLYTHARTVELVKAVSRLKVPGDSPESPLAGLSRDELEQITLGLLLILGTFISPERLTGTASLRARPRAQLEGSSGDHQGRLDTNTGI
jgi:integrase